VKIDAEMYQRIAQAIVEAAGRAVAA